MQECVRRIVLKSEQIYLQKQFLTQVFYSFKKSIQIYRYNKLKILHNRRYMVIS
jgi:hypothetical protein